MIARVRLALLLGLAAAPVSRAPAASADLGPARAAQAEAARRFGHPLPIGALGQTTAHDRLGFDHHNAVDVAVHPDSAEGRALVAHLRAHGIPFLAFRAARAGVATGAHVHVGEPSARRSAGGRITERVARVGQPEEVR